MIALLLAAAAASATPQPGELMTYGDWTVGCDNGRSCKAVSLFSADREGDFEGTVMVAIERAGAANNSATIRIAPFAKITGVTGVFIDGARIESGGTPGAGELQFGGPRAAKLIAAILKGRALELRDVRGAVIGRASLSGSSAALRYIDDRQRRAGTVTALIAKGRKPPGAVPTPPALPVITAAAAAGKAMMPAKAEIERMRGKSQCPEESYQVPTVQTFALDGAHTLVLLSCGAGAYNFSSAPYIARTRGGKRTFTEAAFDFGPGWIDEEDGPALLVNAGWDDKSRVLNSYAKGRGLGDCGSSESYVWDGTRFRLIAETRMSECRGSTDWITTWRATVKR